MDLGLTGKRALVTASSGGVGGAIALALAGEGADVVIHGRDAERAEAVAAAARSTGVGASVVLGDVTAEGGAARVVEAALESGPIDIVVANAGPFAERGFREAGASDWAEAYAANVISATETVRAVLPGMVGRGWGRVITIGTRAAVTPLATMAPYSAAKAALLSATAALAQELEGTGVTANAVSPGVILTDGLRTMFEDRARAEGDERRWEELEPDVTSGYAPNPIGRLGRPEDVAAAVAFLAGEPASYVTGATLRVDGGITGAISL